MSEDPVRKVICVKNRDISKDFKIGKARIFTQSPIKKKKKIKTWRK